MSQRMDPQQVAPEVVQAMYALELQARRSGLGHKLLDLVRLRASYINGCAYCVDMHTKEARAHGETEQRLFAVPLWKETPFFTERERAALAWTEAVTLVAQTGIPDDAFATVRAQFSEDETAKLTLAIIAINGWNRLAIGFRAVPGTYQVDARAATV